MFRGPLRPDDQGDWRITATRTEVQRLRKRERPQWTTGATSPSPKEGVDVLTFYRLPIRDLRSS